MRLSTIWKIETMSTIERLQLSKTWSKKKLVSYLKDLITLLEK